MSCEVAALSFRAHANYGTWSIDFGTDGSIAKSICKIMLLSFLFFSLATRQNEGRGKDSTNGYFY